jgi:DNA-binding MarR family transcriptional regulator
MSGQEPFIHVFQEWIDLFMGRSMRRFIHYARSKGLSLSMIGALFHLQHHKSSGVTDLGDHLGVTSAAASQMLDRLVEQELIQRKEDPQDRRVKQIAITSKGLKVLEEGLKARQSWIIDLEAILTPDQKDQVQNALLLLIDTARRID